MHKKPNQEISAKSPCTDTALREGNNILLTLASDLFLPVQGNYLYLKANWSRGFYSLCFLSWSKSMFVLTLLVKTLLIFSFNPPCIHFILLTNHWNLELHNQLQQFLFSFFFFSISMLFKHLHTYHILLSCSRSNVWTNSSWQDVNVKHYWDLNRGSDCQM